MCPLAWVVLVMVLRRVTGAASVCLTVEGGTSVGRVAGEKAGVGDV